MAHCPHCGGPLADGAHFCTFCGTAVDVPSEEKSTPQKKASNFAVFGAPSRISEDDGDIPDATETADAADTAADPAASSAPPADGSEAPPVDTAAPERSKKGSGQLNVPLILWSIFSILLYPHLIGVGALVLTVFAMLAPSPDREIKRLRLARYTNILAIVVWALLRIIDLLMHL